MPPRKTSAAPAPVPVDHYENFPVASVLCPAHLRAPIAAIYHFARTADDLADEGNAPANERLAALQAYRADLMACAKGKPDSGRWPTVFAPLRQAICTHPLPVSLLGDLLDAFEQDVRWTAQQRRFASDAELLHYCTRSANPVGRLLLHLYGITGPQALAQSDQICTALQLINFWQDIRVDAARGRWYVTQQTMRQFDVLDTDFAPDSNSENASLLIASCAGTARAGMLKGSQLALTLPGRAGWELRLVVQGGLRILDKIEALHYTTWRTRPTLTWLDWPVLLWRAFWMRQPPVGVTPGDAP